MPTDNICNVVKEVKETLIKIYGSRLKGLILYGSCARGDADDGSDIDMLALLQTCRDPMTERRKYFESIWRLGLKYDTVISIMPIDDEEYGNGGSPLILNVKKEGVSL